MKIEKLRYLNVSPRGKMFSGGDVITKGDVRVSYGTGCNESSCRCSEGYWLTIMVPRTSKGIVEGIKVTFKGKKEMQHYLNEML